MVWITSNRTSNNGLNNNTSSYPPEQGVWVPRLGQQMNNDIKDPGCIHPSSLPPLTCWLTVFRLLASWWWCDGCYSSRRCMFTPPDHKQDRGHLGLLWSQHNFSSGKKILPWIRLLMCVCTLSRSVMYNSLLPPWSVACQALLCLEFSSQEYCSG